MALSEIDLTNVLAATRVQSVEVIDGGDTLVVRLHVADGSETCVLLPMGAVGDLLFRIAETLIAGPEEASRIAR